MAMLTPRFLNAGEAALVVEFGSIVDPVINDHVVALDQALGSLTIPGVLETVPTYRSLMIHYDPLILDREALIGKLQTIQLKPRPQQVRKLWTIPCCYEPPFAEDLADVAQAMNLSPDQVVALHSGARFRTYMYGFAPGFCYLGGLPKELAISRRPTPRPPHPPNAILIAGGLSLISTFSMPTGWWVIGRTPMRMFSPWRDPNFLIQIGDSVQFQPIGKQAFDSLEQQAIASEEAAAKSELPR